MTTAAEPHAVDPATTSRPHPGAISAPPAMSPAFRAVYDASRTAFRYANRYAMVPFHRAGLAAWLGSPLTGWQCLVTTTGRRSGLPRHTPLGYLVVDGAAWVMAGYGPATLWYRNVLDDPRVDAPPSGPAADRRARDARRAIRTSGPGSSRRWPVPWRSPGR